MPDKFSKETRSKIMRSIKSKTKMEDRVCKALWNKGLRFRRNIKDLPGKPDIAWKKYKAAVFLDSCYWHVCDIHGHIPQSNVEYWSKKLSRNKERDQVNTAHYLSSGWKVLRVWEHQIKEDFDGTIDLIIDFYEQAKGAQNRTEIESSSVTKSGVH
ncbi:DNA mismatch endonuclease Vsr [Paenibacillus sp. MMS18-CY102]|uniref:DNA mismatch endonuclease Vsr n=1 Tax=Paenibacillus sp. MMS18-CY102 TaxID=2682849 RepID=UPI001365A389|nr:DNA mismatch endonuclease Vsr [Paenibacillus sp. MMS18-CY102]